jgi:hypothetical protein
MQAAGKPQDTSAIELSGQEEARLVSADEQSIGTDQEMMAA